MFMLVFLIKIYETINENKYRKGIYFKKGFYDPSYIYNPDRDTI